MNVQPPRTNPTRRLRRLLILLVTLLVLVAAVPVWLPWLLPLVAGRFGVRIGDYERLSYDRIRLQEVEWKAGATTATIRHLEAPLFWGWLSHRWAGPKESGEPAIEVLGWTITVGKRSSSAPRRADRDSMAELLESINKVLPQAGLWLPPAIARQGECRLGTLVVPVSTAAWNGTGLTLQTGAAPPFGPARLSAVREGRGMLRVDLAMAEAGLSAGVTLAPAAPHWSAEGQARWQGNTVRFSARFDREQWLPATATVDAPDVMASEDLLARLGLDALGGSARVRWTNGVHTFHLEAVARRDGNPVWIADEVAVSLSGQGTIREATIDTLRAVAPPLELALDTPITLGFEQAVSWPEARLMLDYALPEPHQGTVTGSIRMGPGTDGLPRLGFDLGAAPLRLAGVDLLSASCLGELDWPWLRIESAGAWLANQTPLRVQGEVHLVDRSTTNLQAHLSGPIPVDLLPGGLALGAVNASLAIRGAWPDLMHETRLTATDLSVGAFHAGLPELTLRGRGLVATNWTARFQTHQAHLAATGAMRLVHEENRLSLELGTLHAARAGKEFMRLGEPVQLELSRPDAGDTFEARLSPARFIFAKGDGEAGWIGLRGEVSWPGQGAWNLAAEGVTGSDVAALWPIPAAGWTLPVLACGGGWTNGPMAAALTTTVGLEGPGVGRFQVQARVALGQEGVRIGDISLLQEQAVVAFAEGTLPLTVHPSRRAWEWNPDEAVHLAMRTVNGEPLWRMVREKAGLRMVQPQLSLEVTGPVAQAVARLDFQCAEAQWAPPTNAAPEMPPARDVTLRILLERDAVQIERGALRFQDQPVAVYGHYALQAADWREWIGALRRPDWNRISGGVQMAETPMAAFTMLAPEVLLPVGTVGVDWTLHPGGQWDGLLTVTNAATRTVEPFSSLRNIGSRVRLEGRTATLQSFQAELGGQPVQLTGQATFGAGPAPALDLRLQGDNLSLVRTPDLFLRGDLDLRLLGDTGQVPVLQGSVTLRESLLFQDFRSFLDIDLNQPERRPPYFSVKTDPVGDWRLDVQVKGDRFLRIISPAFHGSLSAGLRLAGTLREPLAVGQITAPEGRILFPFGTLDLDRARVTMTEESPHQPGLDIQGTGNSFGYLLRLDASGTAGAPSVAFSSVPPLTPKEILLMLTAGEVPHSRVSFSTLDKAGRLGLYMSKELLSLFTDDGSAADRLLIRSGEEVTDDGRPTYSIEYRLSDRWSAMGEYNRFRDFNSGLKFKLYSK